MNTEDRIISRDDLAHRTSLIEANTAFAKAMERAIRKGKEKVVPGVIVDLRPFTGGIARIIRGEPILSVLGSPAQMCAERGAVGDDRIVVAR